MLQSPAGRTQIIHNWSHYNPLETWNLQQKQWDQSKTNDFYTLKLKSLCVGGCRWSVPWFCKPDTAGSSPGCVKTASSVRQSPYFWCKFTRCGESCRREQPRKKIQKQTVGGDMCSPAGKQRQKWGTNCIQVHPARPKICSLSIK